MNHDRIAAQKRERLNAQRRAELDSLEAKRAGLKKQLAVVADALKAEYLDDKVKTRLHESADVLRREIAALASPSEGMRARLEAIEVEMDLPGVPRSVMLKLIAEREILIRDLGR
jgi:hypothetical protein